MFLKKQKGKNIAESVSFLCSVLQVIMVKVPTS